MYVFFLLRRTWYKKHEVFSMKGEVKRNNQKESGDLSRTDCQIIISLIHGGKELDEEQQQWAEEGVEHQRKQNSHCRHHLH